MHAFAEAVLQRWLQGTKTGMLADTCSAVVDRSTHCGSWHVMAGGLAASSSSAAACSHEHAASQDGSGKQRLAVAGSHWLLASEGTNCGLAGRVTACQPGQVQGSTMALTKGTRHMHRVTRPCYLHHPKQGVQPPSWAPCQNLLPQNLLPPPCYCYRSSSPGTPLLPRGCADGPHTSGPLVTTPAGSLCHGEGVDQALGLPAGALEPALVADLHPHDPQLAAGGGGADQDVAAALIAVS